MSNVIPFQAAQLPNSIMQAMQGMASSELSDNVGTSFAVISVRGKVFRIKHGGTELPLMMNHEGQQFPAPSFDVVIPKANSALSKTYYVAGFTEGSDAQPDCWSEDGVHPLAPMQQRPMMAVDNGAAQHCTDCRLCPMNAFGSRVNQQTGKGGKACADTRKVIVYPAADLVNERFGGAMLLRVPAASLGALAEYDRKLKASGIPYFAVVTRITFDQSVAYPKLEFSPVRMVTDAEAAAIIAARSDSRTDLILNAGQASAPPFAAAALGGPVPAALAAPQVAAPVATMVAPPPAPVVVAPPPAPVAAGITFGAATPIVPPAPSVQVAPVAAPQAPSAMPVVDAAFFAGIDALIQS